MISAIRKYPQFSFFDCFILNYREGLFSHPSIPIERGIVYISTLHHGSVIREEADPQNS